MTTRRLRILMVGMLCVGLLAGCATTANREDSGGLVRAENPEYLGHPLRIIALGFNAVGNVLQYGALEPFYFLLAPLPEFYGLSVEEQRYLHQRQEAWRQYLAGERPAVQ
jgi:hypothetical protein